MELKDVGAIVTGGASGLGQATAELLARLGAKVAIFDLNTDAGRSVAGRISAILVTTEVADDEGVARSLTDAEQQQGTARVLVNCAGVAPAIRGVSKDGILHPLATFRRAIEIDLVGTFNVISKSAAHLIAVGFDDEEAGVIFNSASVEAFDGQGGQAAYTASKGGVFGMTLPIARDLVQHASGW